MLVHAAQRSLLGAPVALLLIALAGCGGGGGQTRHHRGGMQGPPQAVPTASAQSASIRPSVEIAGILAPFQNVSISSSLSEPTDAVYVIQGDHVRRGQVLAVLNTQDLRATYEADERSAIAADARAAQAKYQAQFNLGQGGNQVTSSRAAVMQAKAAMLQAQQDLVRYQALYTSGYISLQQLQDQQTLLRTDQQQVNSAQASLQTASLNAKVNGTPTQGLQAATVASAIADAQSAHAQADQVEAQIQRATIVSPVDGVVVNRNLNPGEYPGSRTIFTVQQLNPVYAELNASSSNIFAITHGSPVSLAVAGVADATYQGHVSAVLGQVTPGSTNFTVEVIVPNPNNRLQSGMAVTGTITLPAVAGVGIPSAAFLDDSHTSVMMVGADGTAEERSVKERGTDGNTSIVSGLALGTKIVANGQLGIAAGQNVAGNPNGPSGGAPQASASPEAAATQDAAAGTNGDGTANAPGAAPNAMGHHGHHRHQQQQQPQ